MSSISVDYPCDWCDYAAYAYWNIITPGDQVQTQRDEG